MALPYHPPTVTLLLRIGLLGLAAAGCSLRGGRFTALEDNDVANIGAGLDTDRDYTEGAGGAFTFTDVDTPAWARTAAGAVPFFGKEGAPVHLALLLGQEIYTPEDLTKSALVPDDRPYAGWLFAGLAIQSPVLDDDPDRRRDRVDTIRLDLGVVGPSARGELAQNVTHRLLDIPEAEGWRNQIPNEPGLLASAETRWRILAGNPWRRVSWDVLPRARIRAGNVRVDASAGIVGRAGMNLPRDFGTMAVDATGLLRGADPPRPWAALHLGIEGSAVAHDLFLEGSTFGDSHSVHPVPWNYDSVAGISAGWGPLTVRYEQHFVSPRFKERRRYHGYATAMISWAWYF
jgi:lipid A 3-O-deacylase